MPCWRITRQHRPWMARGVMRCFLVFDWISKTYLSGVPMYSWWHSQLGGLMQRVKWPNGLAIAAQARATIYTDQICGISALKECDLWQWGSTPTNHAGRSSACGGAGYHKGQSEQSKYSPTSRRLTRTCATSRCPPKQKSVCKRDPEPQITLT